jgi:hypothetical protein
MPFPRLIVICKLAKRMPQPRFSAYFVEIATTTGNVAVEFCGCIREGAMLQDVLEHNDHR